MVTINDVADHVGVSKKTISRVFHKEAVVNDKRREKVLESIEALGYIVNILLLDIYQLERRETI